MHIFVHVDADPDNSDACLFRFPQEVGGQGYLRWNGLISTISFFQELVEKMEVLGLRFKGTFFLRADEQIRSFCGTFSEIFGRICDRLHEPFSVGWHPHLFRWSESSKCWRQEYKDIEWMHRILTDCYDDLVSQGFRIETCKMGWCFHNNTTITTLSNLSVNADFSALPGIRRPGRLINGVSFQDRFDWSKTAAKPYHPSEHNYQKPGGLRILEIPLTTFKTYSLTEFLYRIKLALGAYRRSDFSYIPSLRSAIPLFLPNLTSAHIIEKTCKLLLSQREKDYITFYLHPSNILNANGKSMFESFLLQLISAANKHHKKISFVNALELYSSCKKSLNSV